MKETTSCTKCGGGTGQAHPCRCGVQKLHSELGASVASRWMNCPGSIRLSRGVPRGDGDSSPYAQEGTRAHALAELCLTKGTDPDVYADVTLEGGKVDDDMVEYVRVFVDHCRAIAADATGWWVERKFNLAALKPPAPMFGTADFVAYHHATRTLTVVDLKYGQGVVVEALGNKQLRYYALGAALSLPTEYQVEHVVMTIVQPRVLHPDGVIRSDELTAVDIVEFGAELVQAARATLADDAPLAAGSWCRFCPAAGICPEQRTHALAIAQTEFDVVAADDFTPPAPDTLPIEQLAEMVTQFPVLEAWMSASRAVIKSKLERGESVPGFKLVEKRAQRKWSDAEGVAELLKADGYADEDIFEPRDLKSVAQIERLVGGKKAFAEYGFADAVTKVSSGANVAPDTDPRPAVLARAGDEFTALLTDGS